MVDKCPHEITTRFRGFLPVVVDVETGGKNPDTDALLEVGVTLIEINSQGKLEMGDSYFYHVNPFKGANLDPKSIDFLGIDPYHPFRFAVDEEQAINEIYRIIKKAIKQHNCKRAVLVGHNAAFDHSFLRAADKRIGIKRSPFHPFTTIDTASLCALVLGHTVLATSLRLAGIEFDLCEAHCAQYDAEKTAELFCYLVNRWDEFAGWPCANKEIDK